MLDSTQRLRARLTGSTVTRIPASSATKKEDIPMVIMTIQSSLAGLHGCGTALIDAMLDSETSFAILYEDKNQKYQQM